MDSLIKNYMIDDFNQMMENCNSFYRLQLSKGIPGTIEIVLKQDAYVDEDMRNQVYPNDKFYETLTHYFKQCGIENLTFNNTARIFWGKE